MLWQLSLIYEDQRGGVVEGRALVFRHYLICHIGRHWCRGVQCIHLFSFLQIATILEQLGVGAGPSFRTITDTKLMGKIGFNCQLLLEIGLTTDSNHSTCFHKTVRFSRSKSSRFSMNKFYSIRVGEAVFLKKQRNQNQVKMIRINPSFFSCAKDLTISEGTGVTSLFHSRVLMSFPRKIDKN